MSSKRRAEAAADAELQTILVADFSSPKAVKLEFNKTCKRLDVKSKKTISKDDFADVLETYNVSSSTTDNLAKRFKKSRTSSSVEYPLFIDHAVSLYITGSNDDIDDADGRFHVEIVSVNNVPLELKDLQNRGCKLKIQLDPPGKNRTTRVCQADTDRVTTGGAGDQVMSFDFQHGSTSVLNSVVLPHAINEGGESLMTVWLIQPKKGVSGKDTVLASGSITHEILQRLIVKPTAASKSMQLHIPFQSGMYSMGQSSATVKVTYIPAVAKQAKNVPPSTTPSCNLYSITPKCGSKSGGFVISVRGKKFKDNAMQVHFSHNSQTISSTQVHFVSSSLLEVTVPDLHGFTDHQQKKLVKVTVSCHGVTCEETKHLTVVEKCSIVRSCLKHRGHDGRCCRDEGPPIYARQEVR